MMLIIEKLNSDAERTAFTLQGLKIYRERIRDWSSISRGLRPIQFVKTMTWFSERSEWIRLRLSHHQ